MIATCSLNKVSFNGTQKVSKNTKPKRFIQVSKPASKVVNADINMSYLRRAELVNGRSAMIGFTSAVVEELVNKTPIMEQFTSNVAFTTTVIGLVILGTASNPKDEGLLWGLFDRNAELTNGRLAMIGILSMFVTECVNGPIF